MGEFHPSVAFILQFFAFAHLPEPLRTISSAFAIQALCVARNSPSNQETVVALRKLLESKDAGVRSFVAQARLDAGRDPLAWVKEYDDDKQLAAMLEERKRLDPDAPDAVALGPEYGHPTGKTLDDLG